MNGLLTELETRRENEGLSQEVFAAALGISPSVYSRVRRGHYPAGGRLIKGALRRYPELATVLADEAQGEATEEGAA